MSHPFFEKPIPNSPYACPAQHWELDDNGQPTQQIVASRRRAEFITPIPQPRKRKGLPKQEAVIHAVRKEVDRWRVLPNTADWRVTPETARLLQHWRCHDFSGVLPFFCQIEAVETAIWLTEVAPQPGKAGRVFLDYISGFTHADGAHKADRLQLFRNQDNYGNALGRPPTLLIDSEQLESDEALDDWFRGTAADEIDRFRRKIAERTGDGRSEDQRPGFAARRDEHRGQARPARRLYPLRGLSLDAHRRLGHKHRNPRAGRTCLQHASVFKI